MRILVTGHRGYIGSVLMPLLLSAGYFVQGLDSGLYEECNFIDGVDNSSYVEKDIRDIELSDVEGFDALLHLAGLSNDPLGDLKPQLTYDINYKASLRLAKLAKKAGVCRFIFASSCSNYGAGGNEWVSEESALHPLTAYGISKVRAEQEITELADSCFSPTFLRFATVYGVSPRLRFDLVVNNLTAWAFTTGRVHLKSAGTSWRPLIHVEDVARTIVTVLNASKNIVHNEIFNVGSCSENYVIKEVAGIVENVVAGSCVEFGEGACVDQRSYRVDFSKLKTVFPDLQMKWTVEQGVRQLFDLYSKVGVSLGDFEGKRFNRIDHIKYLLNTEYLDDSFRVRNVKSKRG